MSVEITPETVQHVAKLARLALTPEEVSQYTQDLGNILNMMNDLSALDLTAGYEARTLNQEGTLFREDVVCQKLDRETLMSNAPREEDGFFRVPKILEEGK